MPKTKPVPVDVEKTDYITETRAQLPAVETTSTYPTPVIDKKLIEARNAEAKAMADRIAASQLGPR